jgi:RNA polymerase sigma-70 factor (ECF subfamily)
VDINGAPGVVAWSGADPYVSMSLVVADGRVEQVLIVRNPDKLGSLAR